MRFLREWLRALRVQQSLTQQIVAERTGITRAGYTMIENGDRRPSPEVAKKIARLLGFEAEWYKLLESGEKMA